MVRINPYSSALQSFWKYLESTNANSSSKEKDLNHEDGEVGGLFHVSQRKKINVNDQEDYTLVPQNEKKNWNLDEV